MIKPCRSAGSVAVDKDGRCDYAEGLCSAARVTKLVAFQLYRRSPSQQCRSRTHFFSISASAYESRFASLKMSVGV